MNRRLPLLFVLFATMALAGNSQDQDRWDIMTVKEIGVDRFRAMYPDFDGGGVVIAVLDTGVDMGVEGLKTLPNGETKVVDVRDFTGEGDLFWEEGSLVPGGDKGDKLVDAKGRSLKGFRKAAEGAEPERFYMAFLEESKFSDTAVQDLNGDGDTKDVFGFLIFTTKEAVEEKENGKEEGEEKPEEGQEKKEPRMELRYEAVVDVNGDGNLDDGVRLTDYWRKHQSFALKGKKGDRRQLTMGLNFHPEEKRLSVHFDDGGHGTHVAGITAGYGIHGQEGYNGMAPGAKVISLKIGNNHYAGGSTVTESIKKALDYGAKYAKDHKVPVVYNMSFGIGSEREGKSAVDKYVDNLLWKNPGVVFVTSAGNEGPGLSTVGTPAASIRAIAVGALLSPEAAAAQYGSPVDHEVLFSFSSRGGDTYKPDIVAPGSAASTVPPWGNRDHMHGTSMASPAAAGGIALLVDGLVRHDPPYEIDNALIKRAVKNTGRHVVGLTVLDEGGGALDVPNAYTYAKFLCENKEEETLREYRISNRGPAPGVDTAYWRISPSIPRPSDAANFTIQAGFHDKITAEDKARFYRAFDLMPEKSWISLTKPMVYLKGNSPAMVGVMVDLTGKEPGLYTGKVKAFRKSGDTVAGEPVHEFDLVVSAMIPHRVTPENRGRIMTTGAVRPGDLERIFVEVPVGTTAMTFDLRMLDGGRASTVSGSVFDPEGVARGRVGSVSEQRSTEAHSTLMGDFIVPGTWEIVVSSSTRSNADARYDLGITLSGVHIGAPMPFGGTNGTTRERLLVPFRCTQAIPFNGTVAGRFDGFVKKEVVVADDTDTWTRTVTLDASTTTASWTIEFDRETYALFTDCVLRIEDPDTGKALRNGGLGYRSDSVSITVNRNQTEPKDYKLVLKPAFTVDKDKKKWRFLLTEKLTWNTPPLKLEPVIPQGGRITLMPWDWAHLEFRLPGPMPVAPEGYCLNGVLEAQSGGPQGLILRKSFEM